MLGQHVWKTRQRSLPVLDVDERFRALVPDFRFWTIHRPEPLPDVVPDLVICDPPFTDIRLDRLYRAIHVLAPDQASLLFAWPFYRESALLGTFSGSSLRRLDYVPRYVSVESVDIRFYGSSDDRFTVVDGPDVSLSP